MTDNINRQMMCSAGCSLCTRNNSLRRWNAENAASATK